MPGEQHREFVAIRRIEDPLEAGDAFGVRVERQVRERHAFHGAFAVEELAGAAPPIGGGRDMPLPDVLEPFLQGH